MRIRKRQVPLPLSSLSPVPLSDPILHDLNYSPPPPPPPRMVQLHTHHDPSPTQPKPSNPVEKTAHVGHPHPQPSDHHLNQRLSTIRGGAGKSWGFPDDNHKEHKKVSGGLELLVLKGEEDVGRSRDGDDIKMESVLGAETLMRFASGSSSSSHRAVGRWCEGEKAFPLKKRRGSFERGANGETIMDQKDKQSLKSKVNTKCAIQEQRHDDQKQDDGETKQGIDDHNVNIVNSNANATRKRARGGALMEGSRCSRVNGRGWRCCQQTLVGYSLCEHHLGKGRLRSMTSVRSRSMATSTTTSTTASTETEVKRLSAPRSSLESTHEEDTKAVVELDDYDTHAVKGDHEKLEKPLMITKKRMKLGVVKARSMSSLLGQTNSAIAAVLADDHDDINK